MQRFLAGLQGFGDFGLMAFDVQGKAKTERFAVLKKHKGKVKAFILLGDLYTRKVDERRV